MSLARGIVLFMFAMLVLVCCTTKPHNILNDKKMVEVLQDLYLVDAIMKHRRTDYTSDAYKDALINGVLEKHGISQAELDSSLVWYADNIDLYSVIQDSVGQRLQRRSDTQTAINAEMYTYTMSGFGVTMPEYFGLDVNTPTFRFKIDSIQIKSFEVDKWKLSFDTYGIDTLHHRVESAVYYRYGDTTIVDNRKLKSNLHYVFDKPQRPDTCLLKEVYGYVHMVMATDSMPKVMLTNLRNMNVPTVTVGDTVTEQSSLELLDEMLRETNIK